MSRADSFPPLPDDVALRWSKFGRPGDELFVNLLGLEIEEIRTDYCRMRMPIRPALYQAGGVVHGGAIASLLDSVVVPVVGSAYPREARFATVDMHVTFMAALVGEDAIAEGWAVRRGKRSVFCESEVVGATSGTVVARSMLTYSVSLPKPA